MHIKIKDTTMLLVVLLLLIMGTVGCSKEVAAGSKETSEEVSYTLVPSEMIDMSIEDAEAAEAAEMTESAATAETSSVPDEQSEIKDEAEQLSSIERVELKSIDEIAAEVIDGKWGHGDERKAALIAAGYNPDTVQDRVNEIVAEILEQRMEDSAKAEETKTEGSEPVAEAEEKPTDEINSIPENQPEVSEQDDPAVENSAEVQKPEILPVPDKSVDEVAEEVIDGLWGSDEDRKNRLTAAGYDYDEVQARVNELVAEQKAAEQEEQETASSGGSVSYGTNGRLEIPDLGISVPLTNSVSAVDEWDNAMYADIYDYIIIADHNYQGFSGLWYAYVGCRGYIEQSDGSKRNITCVEVTHDGINDPNEGLLLPNGDSGTWHACEIGAKYVMYTCRPESNGGYYITLTYWNRD